MKNKILVGAFLVTVLLIFGCSGFKTVRSPGFTREAIANQRYQLRVKTGNMAMDKLIYEFAFQEFSPHLPLVEIEPFTGSLDVVFTSTAESPLLGTLTGFVSTGSLGWFTGKGYGNLDINSLALASGIKQGDTFTWQNSRMIATLLKSDGQKIWGADYDYRGRWEVSGIVVHSADQAARLCVQRTVEQFKKEFGQ